MNVSILSQVANLEAETAEDADSVVLTPDQFAQLRHVPAVFADTHTKSERYKQVQTHELISALCETGDFEVVRARLTKTRKQKISAATLRDPLHAKHEVVLRRTNLQTMFDAGAGDLLVPEIYVLNSHNGTSSLDVSEGVYRFRCDNGIIIGNTFAQARIRHSGNAAETAIAKIMKMVKGTGNWIKQVESWKGIELAQADRHEFARLAATLRYGDPHRFDVTDLLNVRREGDDSGDLWTTFNVLQENLMKGGFQGLASTGRRATARPLTEIVKSQEFNADLWNLAEEIAEDHALITV